MSEKYYPRGLAYQSGIPNNDPYTYPLLTKKDEEQFRWSNSADMKNTKMENKDVFGDPFKHFEDKMCKINYYSPNPVPPLK